MSKPMTSWKEIAQYLGRSTRTVQRWETDLGLPVRRTGGVHPKAPVFAIPEEIDVWIRTRHPTRENPAVVTPSPLEDELTRLRRENAQLRRRLQTYEEKMVAAKKSEQTFAPMPLIMTSQ